MSATGRNKAPLALGGVALLLAGAALGYALWPSPSAQPSRPAEAYAPIPKIDVHVHVPPRRALEASEVFAEHGVRLSFNASGGQPGGALDASVAVARDTGGRIRPYCNLEMSDVEAPEFAAYAVAALEQCEADGAVGWKIFKALGLGYTLRDGSLLRVDDPRLDVAFEAAGRLGLPVLIHTGDPQAFFRPVTADNERYAELSAHPSWAFSGQRRNGEPWPSWEEVFDQFEQRVARSPGTTFLGAHFGNAPEEPERVAAMLERYDNLYVETAARIPEIGRHPAETMRRIFVRHRRRILFGTDIQMAGATGWVLGSMGRQPDRRQDVPVFYERHWRYFETADRAFPHPTPIQGEWTIDGLELPRDVLEDVYFRNAERVFGVTLPES